MKILQKFGQRLARYLSEPGQYTAQVATATPDKLQNSLRPGDVLLADGNSRFSTAIKYLTQSSWSHAALFASEIASPADNRTDGNKRQPRLIEADINDGIRTVELSLYAPLHTRICRPVGLNKSEIDTVISYALKRLGHIHDLRNIIDLTRYLLPPLRFPSVSGDVFSPAGAEMPPGQSVLHLLHRHSNPSTILFCRILLLKKQIIRPAEIAAGKSFISVITAFSHQEISMFLHISRSLSQPWKTVLPPTRSHGASIQPQQTKRKNLFVIRNKK